MILETDSSSSVSHLLSGPTMTFRAFSVLASLLFAQPASGQERVSRTLPSGVEVVRDLKYASYGDRQLLLDLYLPGDRRSEQLPVIVVIRGGGWPGTTSSSNSPGL